MPNLLVQMYREHHLGGNKYGFCHHLTTKGKFFKAQVGNGKRVLDLGSRDGILLKTFCLSNVVIGLEIDFEAARLCKKGFNVMVVQHDLNFSLPFKEKTFDVVVAGDVMEHVFLNQQLVQDVWRVLADGGVFLGSTPNAFFWTNRIRFLLGCDPHDFLDPTHVRYFSFCSLRQFLSRRFDKIEILPYGRHWLRWLLPTWFAGDFFWRCQKRLK